MTLQASGAISFSDLRTEYASSGSVSLGSYYRGGGIVRGNSGDNPSTNLSANVPTSGGISMGSFYGQKRAFKYTESTNRTNKEASDYFGTDSSLDYPKEIVISSTVTNNNQNGVALNFASNWDGDTTLTVNGTIRSYSGFCIRNQSSQSITVNGTGSIRKNNKDALVTALQSVNGTVGLSFSAGGFGGASGGGVRHSSVAGNANFHFLLKRSATNTFRFEWTYNECDYANLGGGTENFQTAAASVIPLDSSGNYDDTNTNTYVYNGGTGAAGRDSRDFAAASKIINGQREFWFCTNNKRTWPTDIDGSANAYTQNGHASTGLSASNSRRSSLIQTLTGDHTSGTFSISGPTLTTG